jgi:4-amino-4-deoxy-L-arabinose transferase-like glycosyltransferase
LPLTRIVCDAAVPGAAAFAFAFLFDPKERPVISTVVCGVLVGLTVGTKLTFALVPLCLVLPILAVFGLSARGLNSLLRFIGGLVVSILPAIFICVRAGIDSTFFNNIGYHQLNAIWREQSGFDRAITLPEKFYFARRQLLELSGAMPPIAKAALAVLRM